MLNTHVGESYTKPWKLAKHVGIYLTCSTCRLMQHNKSYGAYSFPPAGFLAITRHRSVGEVTGWVEMIPTSLPELPKPSRTPGRGQKPVLYSRDFWYKVKRTTSQFPYISL